MNEEKFLTQEELIQLEYQCDYLIEDLLRENCVSILSATAKTGKTSFAIDLANAVSTGEDFLGKKTKKTKVLYLSLDDSDVSISERLKIMGLPKNGQVTFCFIRDINIMTLRNEIDKYLSSGNEFGLMIIDMLNDIRNIDPNNEYSNYHMKRDIQELRCISELYHISILALNHNKKKNAKNFIQSSIGSTSLTGTVNGSIMHLSRKDSLCSEGVLKVTGRNVPANAYNLRFNKAKIRYTIEGETVEEISVDLVRIINHVTSEKKFEGTVQQICSKLNIVTNPRIVGKDIRNNIKELEANGIKFKSSKSNGKRIIKLLLIDNFNFEGHEGHVITSRENDGPNDPVDESEG